VHETGFLCVQDEGCGVRTAAMWRLLGSRGGQGMEEEEEAEEEEEEEEEASVVGIGTKSSKCGYIYYQSGQFLTQTNRHLVLFWKKHSGWNVRCGRIFLNF
jgi:hypothetical protein